MKQAANFDSIYTTRKLTNGDTNKIFFSINYSKFSRLNVPLHYSSLNTDENILSVYIKKIIVEKIKIKKRKKYNDMSFTLIKIPTDFKIPIYTSMN